MSNKLVILVFCMLSLSFTAIAQTEEKPSGKLSGVFFMDYYHNLARDGEINNLSNSVSKGEKDAHGLQIRRINLTYDHKINSKFSSKFRLESDESNFTTNSGGNKANKFGMFVKDAYVKWNYAKRQDLYVGIQGTPNFEVSEKVWENRYIEKMIQDLRGACPSRDLGIALKGSIDSAGIVKYQVMYANGNAGLPESEKFKRMYGSLDFAPIKNLYVTLAANYQWRDFKESKFEADKMLSNNILLYSFFLGYQKKNKYSAGVETYIRATENGYELTDKYEKLQGHGISAFATFYLNEKFNIFARYDIFEPNQHDDAKHDSRNLLIAGFGFKPNSSIIFSGNLFYETYEKLEDKEIKSSMTPRLTLSWSF